MMKIAITGEGNTDYGKKEYGTGEWLPGPAIIYAEKIAKEQGMNVELLPIEKQDVMKVRVQGRSTKGLSGRGIPMIPLSMIECWMLGDKAALEQIFHLSISERKLPDKPEYVWGAKTDPNSDYPKNYFVRLIRSLDHRYGTYQSCQEDFNKIADHSTISTLRKTCPLSYERFYTDFINLLKNVNE